jgi:hypothetical protein
MESTGERGGGGPWGADGRTATDMDAMLQDQDGVRPAGARTDDGNSSTAQQHRTCLGE